MLEHAVTASGYVESLRAEDSVEADGRLENLAELLTSASEYETCDRFLEQVALVNDTDDLPDGEMVSLMTLHAAKGLEYPVVFFTGLEDGICPHYMSVGSPEAMEEERRVAFVGFTRAKQRLYLTSAAERTRHRKVRREPQSQFIEEALQNVVGLAA
ncbi:MAG TPA: hypothetical protein DEP66_01425 [Acidimicrobiaceae bacterium]|nr:hypothetical protein [Acidimicrobiaceae bacterium]